MSITQIQANALSKILELFNRLSTIIYFLEDSATGLSFETERFFDYPRIKKIYDSEYVRYY